MKKLKEECVSNITGDVLALIGDLKVIFDYDDIVFKLLIILKQLLFATNELKFLKVNWVNYLQRIHAKIQQLLLFLGVLLNDYADEDTNKMEVHKKDFGFSFRIEMLQ
jgi:hypothetical protein